MAEPVYRPIVGVTRTVFLALGLRFDITGEEYVPASGGAVVAMNHIGYLDFALAGLAFRPKKRLVRFMAKKEVFDHKVSGPLMRGMKHIPVDRGAGAGAFSAAVDALRRGELVGVFPEATISQSFELKEFKNGAVRMATEAGVPIIPVIVWGSQRIWTKGRPKDFKRHRHHITLVVGEPFTPGEDATAATAELKHRMQALLTTAHGRHADPVQAGAWWLPVSMGGTAPTLEQAESDDAEVRAERAARRAERGD